MNQPLSGQLTADSRTGGQIRLTFRVLHVAALVTVIIVSKAAITATVVTVVRADKAAITTAIAAVVTATIIIIIVAVIAALLAVTTAVIAVVIVASPIISTAAMAVIYLGQLRVIFGRLAIFNPWSDCPVLTKGCHESLPTLKYRFPACKVTCLPSRCSFAAAKSYACLYRAGRYLATPCILPASWCRLDVVAQWRSPAP